MEYNADFQLILHTKLANPHYKPEMQAQATLINFTVSTSLSLSLSLSLYPLQTRDAGAGHPHQLHRQYHSHSLSLSLHYKPEMQAQATLINFTVSTSLSLLPPKERDQGNSAFSKQPSGPLLGVFQLEQEEPSMFDSLHSFGDSTNRNAKGQNPCLWFLSLLVNTTREV